MNTKEKEQRLKVSIKTMTETELKEICFDSFIDGLEKGIKINDIKVKNIVEKETA